MGWQARRALKSNRQAPLQKDESRAVVAAHPVSCFVATDTRFSPPSRHVDASRCWRALCVVSTEDSGEICYHKTAVSVRCCFCKEHSTQARETELTRASEVSTKHYTNHYTNTWS